MEKGLNSFQIKTIAILVMVIDHIGALFFPSVSIIRIIGRIAFPLFAFLIAEGFRHTRSVKGYLFRLGLCAILFQLPDWLFGSESIRGIFMAWGWQSVPSVNYVFNIFSTLFLGLAAISLFDRLKEKHIALSWMMPATVAVIAEAVGADYGAYGVFYILVFYLAGRSPRKLLTGGMILHIVYAVYEMTRSYLIAGSVGFPHSIQLYSLLSLGIIVLYNQKQGRKMKYFFYLFYPAHLLILYVIQAFL